MNPNPAFAPPVVEPAASSHATHATGGTSAAAEGDAASDGHLTDLTVTDDEVFADGKPFKFAIAAHTLSSCPPTHTTSPRTDTDPSCLVTQVANPEADDYDDDFVDP